MHPMQLTNRSGVQAKDRIERVLAVLALIGVVALGVGAFGGLVPMLTSPQAIAGSH